LHAAAKGQKEMFDFLIKEYNCSTTSQNDLEKVAEFYWEQQNSLPIQKFESKKSPSQRKKKMTSSGKGKEPERKLLKRLSSLGIKLRSKTKTEGETEKGFDKSLVTLDEKQDDEKNDAQKPKKGNKNEGNKTKKNTK